MSKEVIMDASAILALLNEQPGHQRVEESLSQAITSSVNFAEVITVLTDVGLKSEEAASITSALLTDIVSFDQQQALVSASLRKLTRSHGLSFGDRACLSLAKQRGTLVLTADKVWAKLHIPGVKIELIR